MHVRRVHQNLQPSLIIRPHGWKKGKGEGKKKGLCVTWFKDFWFLPLLLPILDPFSVVRLIRSHNVDEFFLIPILNNFKSFVKYVCLFVGKPSSFVLPVCYIGYIRKHGFIILHVTHVTFREFSASNNFMLPPHEAKVSCGERSDKKRFASFIKGNSHTHTLETLNYHWANFFLVINPGQKSPRRSFSFSSKRISEHQTTWPNPT